MGRRQAATRVKRALSSSRLVTLTGFGGIGKSRLALHVAHDVRRAFSAGTFLVELANVRDPMLVPQAVAAALGIHDRSTRAPEAVLVDYLADKQVLLVLDNCEHLLGACSRLVAVLLAAAPRLRILATSREHLGIVAEQTWPVPPLSVPAGSDSSTSQQEGRPYQREALTLFEQRAAAALPGFTINEENEQIVARLCRRLDGIPLAIELAAVRVRVLSVGQILTRMENRFRLLTTGDRADDPRHQTLRAAVDWSYNLCNEHEKQLWARCSVFTDEFDLDAAENVCTGDGLTDDDVFAALAGLIDKSVLTRTEERTKTRYRMLETIRQYGHDRLTEAGAENALRCRHRDYYLHLAEQSDAESAGPHQAGWLARLRAERGNFWAALDYCFTTPGEASVGLRMVSALWFYWAAGDYLREGRMWLDRALALETEPTSQRARALWITGWIAHRQGDRDGALVLLNESRELARKLGDETEFTYATQFLGDREMWDNNLTRATQLLDEALARHRATGHWTGPALAIFSIRAQAAGLLGDLDRAMVLLHECRKICTELGERWRLSWAEWNMAITWWAAGDPTKAAASASRSLRNKRELNDLLGISDCVELLAWVAAAERNPERAAILFGALDKMWELIGTPLFGSETLLTWREQAKARAQEALTDTEYETARGQGTRMNREQTIFYALGEKPPPVEAAAASAPETEPVLTKREREVAALVTAGKTNKEIAADLVISQRTAEAHVENILSKLGFTSRAQVISWMTGQR